MRGKGIFYKIIIQSKRKRYFYIHGPLISDKMIEEMMNERGAKYMIILETGHIGFIRGEKSNLFMMYVMIGGKKIYFF